MDSENPVVDSATEKPKRKLSLRKKTAPEASASLSTSVPEPTAPEATVPPLAPAEDVAEVKPKRTRRTKTQIEADKAAEEAAKAVADASAETEAEVKPKRTRRTKAQIEADKAAEEAAKAAASDEAAAETAEAEAEVKPKRTRRTKAQIEADKAAEEAAKAAASDEVAAESAEAETEVKPKRTRRTKAQIEADKAAEEAAKAAAETAPKKDATSAAPLDPAAQVTALLNRLAADGHIDQAALPAFLALVPVNPETAKAAALATIKETLPEEYIAAAMNPAASAAETDASVDEADTKEDESLDEAEEAESAVAESSAAKSKNTASNEITPLTESTTAYTKDKPSWKDRPRPTAQERAERRDKVIRERKAADERRAREREERDKFLNFLALAFPKAIFPDREQRIPLKVGIAQDILDRLKGMDSQFKYFNKQRYKILHNYCHSLPYLQKLADGVPRIDLDGNPAGEVEEEHRTNAKAEIERINTEMQKKVEQAKKAAAKQRPQKQHRQFKPRQSYGGRSEERRVGKECRSRWSPYH